MRRFLRVVILVGAGACDPASAQPAAPPSPPAPAPSPAAAIPTELTAAPAWIGRVFTTGLVTRDHTHVTRTLRRHGVQALLTIETQVAESKMFEVGPWKPRSVATYLGTATENGAIVTLELTNIADATDTLSLPCRKQPIAAAPSTAVRRATPTSTECGDRGRWHPKTTRKVTALACLPVSNKAYDFEDDTTWPSAPHIAFAPSPGIEWLYVNDDCLQGGGWRQAPANRSIVMDVRHDGSKNAK